METKSFLKSKTLWGGLIMILGFVLKLFGIELWSEGEQEAIVQGVIQVVGFILVVWGRVTAKTSIGVTSE